MKHIFTIFMIVLFSQFSNAQQTYQPQWEEVLNLEKKGLTQSAFKKVTEIYQQAKKEQNNPQIIKAFLHKAKYQIILEEDAQLTIITDLQNEIDSQKGVAKNILHSILANIYWKYLQNNRYQFYNRTETTEKVDATDFRTWDLTTIFKEIIYHFDASLANTTSLQKQTLSAYSEILYEEKDSKIYRPTVYDLLAHNALQFYRTDENTLTKPADVFEIDNEEYLCNAEMFANISLTTNDRLSLEFKALEIYQNLIRFHLKDTTPEALIDVNIERLQYVAQKAAFDNSTEKLIQAYQNEKNTYASHPFSGMYDVESALLHQEQAAKYDPKKGDAYQWEYNKAIELCEAVITKFPTSIAAEKCKTILLRIKRPEIDVKTEKYIPIGQVSKVYVRYKNIPQLYFSTRSITEEQYVRLLQLYRRDERYAFISKLPVNQQWNVKLPTENDHQIHSTEIVVPKLANGFHLIIASPDQSLNKDFHAYGIIQVTDFAVTHKKESQNYIFQVTERTNGQPIINQEVTISYQMGYEKNKIRKTFTTDRTGSFVLEGNRHRNFRNISVSIETEKDRAYFSNVGYFYTQSQNKEKPRKNLFLFTDRSIYRPSQIVHFKGILIEKEENTSSILSKQTITVTLYDANGQKVQTQTLLTNEYGSIKGEFVIPNSGLTGLYQLSGFLNDSSIGYASFSVEEYKRPKFEAEFLPITETYSVNDTVTVKGKAIAFAGSAISDAKVTYSVQRTPSYPQWSYWRFPYLNTSSQQIVSGETTTDATGNFMIDFKAIPDSKIDKNLQPTFAYKITADITDINGETRSTYTTVYVGYHRITANVSIPKKLDTSRKDYNVEVNTHNLNGEKVPAQGILTIHKLQAPKRILRKRVLPIPDLPSIQQDEFVQLFPHEAFSEEEQTFQYWEKGKEVLHETFDTEKSSKLSLGKIKRWETGKYVVTFTTTDANGIVVKDIAYTEVWNPKENDASDQAILEVFTDKDSYTPNNEVVVTLKSAVKGLHVFVDIEKNHRIVESYMITLQGEQKTLRVPVSKEDEGGFRIHCSATIFNSFVYKEIPVMVAYPTTDLTIETRTFRDKLKPAQEETWSFTIKGSKGEKVAAEMLASMYDASLDEFRSHYWDFSPIAQPFYYSTISISAKESFDLENFNEHQTIPYPNYVTQNYDRLNWFGFYLHNQRRMYNKGYLQETASTQRLMSLSVKDDIEFEEDVYLGFASGRTSIKEQELTQSLKGQAAGINVEANNENTKEAAIVPRKNLQETAFFYPQLHTDNEGNVTFSFTTPEALTKWNVQLLAHTKELHSAVKTLSTVTQKELMVLPNVPRFFREGDKIVVSTKISNLSDKKLSGQAMLQLVDPLTGNDINPALFPRLGEPEQSFSVDAKGNTQVSWLLYIPSSIQAVQYTITAKANEFSDGEQNALPVLSNRMLVTETLPMWIRSNETKTFTLDKLKNNTSTTLKHHKLSLEMTSNPAWYAVQALPYLMEYPYECAEQTFARYYANALASHIANSNPRIQQVFEQWKSSDALLSNLEKNQELKSLIIQETPWVRDALSESEQKKRIALLFDLNRMKNEQNNTLRKLSQMQLPSGGFPWFSGGRENRFVTQHIITGLGHLHKLGVQTKDNNELTSVIQNAITYLDAAFVQEYKDIRKYSETVDLSKDHLSYMQLHYLYMRSFYKDISMSEEVAKIADYYLGQIDKYWLSRNLFSKGMMALVSHRMNRSKTAQAIIRSLEENSITSDELGMYWKANTPSWYWYQAPVETQALLIEAFAEISNDITIVDNLKIWLLKHKQTNRWATTKATSDAVYALLLQGSDWLSVTEMVEVTIGNQKVTPANLEDVKIEAGTGYYKTSWNENDINSKMATVTLSKKDKGIAWGGLYWQYFEDLDNITSAETSLKLDKKLFKRTYGDTGEIITEITENTVLEVGDLIRVRIELRNDRPMEFVHMKDMRASGVEPVNVLSQYKWQDGLGYYESTKDASTNFFFDYLPKGVFVFEYDLRVNNKGEFSNGITTIQSMYAPEFSSHSKGERIEVK
ncbi:alpha-2-macroglobulin family protein [Kordia zhangzhouensis]|uniref:alpha-2-macroglobulin family protein n=1 Tax=Kordia zhangzhouensis TaxID=1620405 RepID=UPI0006293BC2|nr:MG2 domain-containing protein [Kordia zhangzhouensis]